MGACQVGAPRQADLLKRDRRALPRRVLATIPSLLLPGSGHFMLGWSARGLRWMVSTLAAGPVVFVLSQIGERSLPDIALSLILSLMAVLFVFQLGVFAAALVDVWRLPVPATGPPGVLRSGGLAVMAAAIGFLTLTVTTAAFRAPGCRPARCSRRCSSATTSW